MTRAFNYFEVAILYILDFGHTLNHRVLIFISIYGLVVSFNIPNMLMRGRERRGEERREKAWLEYHHPNILISTRFI
jgi:hypothetical protein